MKCIFWQWFLFLFRELREFIFDSSKIFSLLFCVDLRWTAFFDHGFCCFAFINMNSIFYPYGICSCQRQGKGRRNQNQWTRIGLSARCFSVVIQLSLCWETRNSCENMSSIDRMSRLVLTQTLSCFSMWMNSISIAFYS